MHVHDGQHALFGQAYRVQLPVADVDLFLVGLQPVAILHLGFLLVADVLHVLLDGAFGALLVGGDQGQLDVVAVGGLGIADLAGQLTVAVALHDAAALALGDAGGQPVLLALFDAVQADLVVQGVAGGLVVFVIGVIALDLARVADDLGGQSGARVNALFAHLDGDAGQ